MHSASKAMLVLMILAFFSLWGCAQQHPGPSSYHSRIRDLEARQAKLEEDYRVVSAANETLRKKTAQLEAQRNELNQKIVHQEEQGRQLVRQCDQLQQQLQARTGERDELQEQLQARIGERDQFHDQLVQFSQELQTLAGRVEAAASKLGANLSLTSAGYADHMPPAQ